MSASQPNAASVPTSPGSDLLDAFSAIVGTSNVLASSDERRTYAHDRLPFANFLGREGRLAGTLPSFVVRPADAEETGRIVRLAREFGVRLIPYGNGSGVLGGAIPLCGEVMVDLRRLDGIVELNRQDAMVSVRAGMNGGAFEAALNEQGLTCGHLPQSIEISTVGGWAACRGGGQASSRYGKIEDIVIGLKAILPDGTPIEIKPVARRSVGPSVLDLLVGSEGTLGIITELTLRVWEKPAVERGIVLALPSLGAALDSARQIMQAGLRPTIVRLYDAVESAERTQGIATFGDKPILAIMVFEGSEPLVSAEQDAALAIITEAGGEVVPDEGPFRHWKENRYVAYSQKWQAAGYYNDTIEVTGNWSALPAMYESMAAAAREICPDIHFGAHWSHVYPEGACQYMTIRMPPMEQSAALPLHARLWDRIETLTLDHGGSIAHHHGAGLFRGPWMRRELGAGLDVLQAIKDALDPGNLMNPGKLGLRAPDGAAPTLGG